MSTAYDSAIEQITQSVFSTMPGLELVRVDMAPPADADLLLVAVHIAGTWTGSVVLGLPNDVVRAAAAGMLQIPRESVGDEDCRDVAAELVNMIGGNLKSLLPAPSYLSLPTIVNGTHGDIEVRDGRLAEDLAFMSEVGLIAVRVYERTVESENRIVSGM